MVSLLTALTLLVVLDCAAASQCPTSDGFEMVQGRCVRFFSDSHLPDKARDTCSGFGAILYPFRSLVQDQGPMQALMQAAGKTSVMVGVSDAADDDVFVADDGTPVEDGVWAVGQPQNAPGEDCAYVKENLGFKLADTSCTNGFPYVCEKIRRECPTSDGFEMVQGRCVRLFTDSHLPAVARDTCSGFGAILYPFRSLVQDQGPLQALMQAAGKPSVMVGVSDAADDDVFVADDGTPVKEGVWAVGQPNGAPGEDCAYVKENLGFKLADTSCTNGFPYVCEVPLPLTVVWVDFPFVRF